MNTIGANHDRFFTREPRLLDMFDGALPPASPALATATHDFLVMCLRPGDPPVPRPHAELRSAA